LSHSPSRRRLSTAGQRALARLLSHAGPEQKRVLQVAGLLGVVDLPAFRAARRLLVKTARDENRPASERIAALASLAGAPSAELTELRDLLEARQPLDVQLAAAGLLAAADDAAIVHGLFKRWKSLSPRAQTTILDVVCGRKDRLTLVLDAIEKRRIEPGTLPAARQTQLQE